MQNKRRRQQSIDNFVPQGRPLGSPAPRQPQQFPDVGMTMSSYSAQRGTLPPVSGGTQAFESPYSRRRGKRKGRRWFPGRLSKRKKIILLLLSPFLLILLWLGIKFAFNAANIFNGNLFSIFSTTQLKGEQDGRVNILLAGNSTDDPGHNGAALTDSIMIMSLDTRNHKAFLLSVPRDLYVDIAGYHHAKINEAYVAGVDQKFNAPGYPRGGMGLLEQTIGESLGIKIHYYALINYSALREAVNAVGGVDVTVSGAPTNCGLYDPSIDWSTRGPLVDHLKNGVHHLDGRQALNLARARGEARGSCGYANSDFTRTEYQRKLLVGLKSKIFSTGVLANPVKISNLFDSLGHNVKSDMELSEVRRLYDLMKDVDNNKIKSYGLNDLNGKDYLGSYRTETGQSALVPAAGVDDFSDIQHAIQRLMSGSKVVQEDAHIVVLNGTDTYGLAGSNQTILSKRALNVIAIADATSTVARTYIINASGGQMPATLKSLKTVYQGAKVTTSNPYASKYDSADFIVVLGNDRVSGSQ